MLMLALLPIGLLALRCVEALAPRFGDLLFNFFVLRSACCSTCCSTLASLATAARPAAHPAAPLPLISLLLILLFILLILLFTLLFDCCSSCCGSERPNTQRSWETCGGCVLSDATLMRECCVFPECRSAVPTAAFGDSRLRPARPVAPNVASHADDSQSMLGPGL